MKHSVYSIFSFLTVFVVLMFTAQLPFVTDLNQLFLDRMQGNIIARPEVVIAAIDDVSLQQVGAWPWDRQVFANLIGKLESAGARAIGIDVLFLEPRQGDAQLVEKLNNSNVPIVLSSKLVDQQELTSFFTGPKVINGFTNFPTDSDGKIRTSLLFLQAESQCFTGFAYSVFQAYLKPNQPVGCTPPASNTLLPSNNRISFHYTDQAFTQHSVSSILDGSVAESQFKDKIVLIGSTAIDVRSNLNDNFIDIFGRALPGVVIHANVVNSLLEQQILTPLPPLVSFFIHLGLAGVSFWLYRRIKSNAMDILVLVVILISTLIAGLLVFDVQIQWPFVTTIIILVGTYIFSLAQKFILANQDKAFIQNAFTQYMNPALVQRLIDNPEQLKLGGEKRVMTLMFSDVRGFTSLSEKISPEELVSLLNAYMDSMCQIIMNNQGVIDKFIGDAIMAFWNAPLDNKHHRQLAIQTGVAMIEALEKFNTTHSHPPLSIGIGINTGEMVVGNIGSQQRFDYTVLGDNVNLASRIEGLTKKYGVLLLVADSVIKDLSIDGIIYRHVDTLTVKGKSLPVKLYQPLPSNPANIQLKREYEHGWKAYAKGDWQTAEQTWSHLAATDPTSQIMLERIPKVKKFKEWKGVWEWLEK